MPFIRDRGCIDTSSAIFPLLLSLLQQTPQYIINFNCQYCKLLKDVHSVWYVKLFKYINQLFLYCFSRLRVKIPKLFQTIMGCGTKPKFHDSLYLPFNGYWLQHHRCTDGLIPVIHHGLASSSLFLIGTAAGLEEMTK